MKRKRKADPMKLNVYVVVVGLKHAIRCVSLSHANAVHNRNKAQGRVCYVEVRA